LRKLPKAKPKRTTKMAKRGIRYALRYHSRTWTPGHCELKDFMR
jgi:hypothetical protein